MISEQYRNDPVYRAYIDAIAARRPNWSEEQVEGIRRLVRAGRREAEAADGRVAS